MIPDVSEAAVIENLLPQLEAEGYDVFVNPGKPLVPEFFGSYKPDLIALRQDRKLAIEVTRPNKSVELKLQDIATLFKGRDDWEFRIIWVPGSKSASSLTKQSGAEIDHKLAEINNLIEGEHFDAAFLISWAVLEAIGRSISEEKFRRPQTPARLIEVLAGDGVLSPSEADTLRPLIEQRNRLTHGELLVRISEQDARSIASILHTIVNTPVQ